MRDRHTYERSRVINRIRLLMGAGWWMQMLEQLHPSDTVFDMRERADGCRCIHPSCMYQIAVSFYVVNCHPHHRCATRVGQRERRSRCRDRSTGEDSHPEVSTHQSRRVCACAYRCLHVLAIGRGREHVACHDDVVLQASHRHSSLTCSSLCSPAL